MTRKERANHVRALAAILDDHAVEREILGTLAGAIREGEETLGTLALAVAHWKNTVGVPRALESLLGRERSRK